MGGSGRDSRPRPAIRSALTGSALFPLTRVRAPAVSRWRLTWVLILGALAVAFVAALPLFVVAGRAVTAAPSVWLGLWSGQIPGLLGNTLALVVATVSFAVVIGVALAWLTERTDLPGAPLWRWALAIPLVIPAYVAALALIVLLRRGGLIDRFLTGALGAVPGTVPLPDLFGLGGATLTIALCVFPYVYLPAAVALRSQDRALEDASRLAGRGRVTTLIRVTLPLAAPAIAAGALLVGLYVLSDFGTVSLLRYRTFTTVIFNQFAGQIDRSAAACLSVILIVLTTPMLAVEALLSRRGRRLAAASGWRPPRRHALGAWRVPALGGVILVAVLSLGVPLFTLGGLALQGWLAPTDVDRVWSVGNDGLGQQTLNSLVVSALAATVALTCAFAPALLAARYPSWPSRVLLGLCLSAAILPGLIVGLALVLFLATWAPAVHGTALGLGLGLTLRALPSALAAAEPALRGVPPLFERAARSLGSSPVAVLRRITLPLAAPGLSGGWVLAFLTAMKELPTALMMRPPGFDTLPVRIMAAANESVYTQAAPPALALVAATALPLLLLARRGERGLEGAARTNG